MVETKEPQRTSEVSIPFEFGFEIHGLAVLVAKSFA